MTYRADVLESLSSNKLNSKSNNKPAHSNSSSRPITYYPQSSKTGCHTCTNQASNIRVSTRFTNYDCVICKDKHKVFDCPTFQAMSAVERNTAASKLGLCLNCLRYGHPTHSCHWGTCRECNGRHNTILHIPMGAKLTPEPEVPNQSIVTFSNQDSIEVMLCTALVQVINPATNECETVRALLDCGSQSSFITESLKQRLSLKSNATQISVIGIGNQCNNNVTENCVVKMQSTQDNFNLTFSCLVLNQLTGLLPKNHISIQSFKLPKNIQLADPKFNQPAPVDMLLGADVFWVLLGSDIINLGKHLPQLRSSHLGWLVAGKITNKITFNAIIQFIHKLTSSLTFQNFTNKCVSSGSWKNYHKPVL